VNTLLQEKRAARVDDNSRAERLRQDRLTAFLGFAQSIADFRSAQIERWNAERSYSKDSDQYRRAVEEAHRTGAVARSARFRVELAIDNEELLGLAQEALTFALSAAQSDNENKLKESIEHSREKTEAFIGSAGKLGQVR
jgi:hypothetical protein